jgi:hypothetical protein
LAATIPAVEATLRSQYPIPANVGQAPEAMALWQQAYSNQAGNVMAAGIWRNVNNGVGFYDTFSHTFLADKNGKPFVWSYENILANGDRRAKEDPNIWKGLPNTFGSTGGPRGGIGLPGAGTPNAIGLDVQ